VIVVQASVDRVRNRSDVLGLDGEDVLVRQEEGYSITAGGEVVVEEVDTVSVSGTLR
jgi:hypothetical protein